MEQTDMRGGNRFVTALGLLFVAGAIGCSFFSVPVSDDYHFMSEAGTVSILDRLAARYHHWDARILHEAVLAVAVRDIRLLSFWVSIWAACFLACAAVLARILEAVEVRRAPRMERVNRTLMLTAVVWMGVRPVEADGVYWASGGMYAMYLLAALLLAWGMIVVSHPGRPRLTGWTLLPVFILGLFLGVLTHHQSLAIVVMALAIPVAASRWRGAPSAARPGRLPLALAAGALLGFLFITLSPGAFSRMHVVSPEGHSIQGLLTAPVDVLLRYVEWGWRLLLVGIPSVLILWHSTPSRDDVERSRERRSTATSLGVVFLAAALSSVIVLSPVPGLAMQQRVSLFFLFTCFTGLLLVATPFVRSSLPVLAARVRLWPALVSALRIAVLLLALGVLSRDLILAHAFKTEWLERHETILRTRQQNADLIVPMLRSPVPTPLKYEEFASDPDAGGNPAAARYYGVASLRILARHEEARTSSASTCDNSVTPSVP